MAKRFTDTEKFIDPWYRRLSTKNKILWDWLLCNCDHAGIITIDFEFVEMVLSEKYEDDVIERFFSDRVIQISPAKFFIPKFLKFQYGKLNPNSKVHASVIGRLEDEGIIVGDETSINSIENNARFIGYPKGIDTIKEKAQAKDKDKAKVKEPEFENSHPSVPTPAPSELAGISSPDQLLQLWNSDFFLKGFPAAPLTLGGTYQQNFFLVNKRLRESGISWADYLARIENSTFLTQKKRGGKPAITWVLCEKNFDDVWSGKYDDGAENQSALAYANSIKLG